MPEPLLYVQSLGAAALAGAVCVLAMAARRAVGPVQLNAACVLGGCLGVAAGCFLLRWRLVWPPPSALDRVVMIIIPAASSIELVAGSPGIGQKLARAFRVIFVATAPLVLLHGSIYLTGSSGEWAMWQAGILVATCSALLAALWIPLAWLSRRSRSGLSIAGSLVLATLCAGGAVMLGGYLKGGAVTFAFAGSLAGVTLAGRVIAPRLAPAIVALGVIQLFGVVGAGHFFGRLPLGSALGLLLAPLLCCVSEIPLLRQRPAWVVGTVRLVLVAIPLLAILTVAKLNFDRKLAPLLSQTRPVTARPAISPEIEGASDQQEWSAQPRNGFVNEFTSNPARVLQNRAIATL